MEKVEKNMSEKSVGKKRKSSAGKDVALISETGLQNKIYEIRGQRVMLDFDLAEIYGYTTSAFNQQVQRNIEKFEEDFMFQLTRDEAERLVISQNVISRTSNLLSGQGGGSRYLPHAFTEQGIYMLMTVLRGELATKQSKALIRLFKKMKDFIVENREALQEMRLMDARMGRLDARIDDVEKKLGDVVMRSEISPVILDFANASGARDEIVFLNGEPLKADVMYAEIFGKARVSIHIIDNYISLKTLRHLGNAPEGTRLVVFSDNLGGSLHLSDYHDFRREFPGLKIKFIRTAGKSHDRFIMIDRDAETEHVYHCGASIKDAGSRLSMVTEIVGDDTKQAVREAVDEMLKNKRLELS